MDRILMTRNGTCRMKKSSQRNLCTIENFEQDIDNYLKHEEQVSLEDAILSLGISKVKKNQGDCIKVGKYFFDVSNVMEKINIDKFYTFPSPFRNEIILRFILKTNEHRSQWCLQMMNERIEYPHAIRISFTKYLFYYELSFSYKKGEDPLLIWLCEKLSSNTKEKSNTLKKKKISITLKRLVWNKHFTESCGTALCSCCKLTTISQLNFHCGHIVAEINGGSTKLDNLIPICQYCNLSMGTKNMQDFMRSQGF